MTLRTKIAVVAATLFLGGCQELPGYFASDTTLARAGGSELKMRDVESVVPKGVTGEDSAAFMKVYIDRWVRKQLKLQEAEILFSASADDIDKMVEEYRQALLIRKLDQHYVDRSIDTTFTENEIAAYYNAHKADFRLDRTLVKGRIVQFGEGYRQARKLRELMGTKSEARQQDFIVDDTTLFWVVLHLLVVFTEQLFATLVSSGGNRRLPLAALNNRDFVVWTGHFVSLLSVIGGWGGVLPPHLGQKKSRRPFQISCSVCRCVGGGYLVIKVRGKLTRCEVDKLKFMVLHRCSYFNQITVQIIKTNYFLSPTMCHKFINILN